MKCDHLITCEDCKHKGWTTHENTGDGVKHWCHCTFDGIRRSEFAPACDKFERYKTEEV